MECDPKDIAIKCFFLGPQAENSAWLLRKWNEILENWIAWRRNLFPQDGVGITDSDRLSPEFKAAMGRLDSEVSSILRELENETPKFTPRYIGHMVSEVSLPALLGHVCALLHNPNNTSREVSKVTSRLEDEAILDLAKMVGFPNSARGHFTSGGTMANYEALWHALVRADRAYGEAGFLTLGPWEWARQYKQMKSVEFPGFVILVPGNKHFSWEKAVTLLGLGAQSFWSVALDEDGRLDSQDLKRLIDRALGEQRQVLMVVSVAGTTEMGEVDPIHEVQDILDGYRKIGVDIWHHVDGAYGAYFSTLLDGGVFEAKLTPPVARALRAVRRVDSITIDPHKLGYVPYACGAFLVRDENHYRTREVSAAYLRSDNRGRWAETLEGSRSGAGVTATWLSNRVLGLNADGYGRLLGKGLEARDRLVEVLKQRVPNVLFMRPTDLNVLCFSLASPGEALSQVNRRGETIWRHFEASPRFSVSKTILRRKQYGPLIEKMARERSLVLDSEEWLQIRLVLMNPFLTSKELNTDLIGEFAEELMTAARH